MKNKDTQSVPETKSFEAWLKEDTVTPSADFNARVQERIAQDKPVQAALSGRSWLPIFAIAAAIAVAAALWMPNFLMTGSNSEREAAAEGSILPEEAYFLADYFHDIDPVVFTEVADFLEFL